MITIELGEVYQRIEAALDANDLRTAEHWLWDGLNQFHRDAQLWFYAGHVLSVQDRNAVALLCLDKAIELLPAGPAYTNRGAILRRLNRVDEARESMMIALEYGMKDPNTWNNLAASYINEGDPLAGIPYAEKALELKSDFYKARWNLALLQLEAGLFETGFENYTAGIAAEQRPNRTYAHEGNEPAYLRERSQLEGRPRIVVWGEQGIGDELMFSTQLPALNEHADIVFDCHPRLESIYRASYPFIKELHPTRKDEWIKWPLETEACELKCSLGDLPAVLPPPFVHGEPAQPRAVADGRAYRAALRKEFPHEKLIGVAWTGGNPKTHRGYRTIKLDLLSDIFDRDDVQGVSLQYEDATPQISAFMEKYERLILDFPAITSHFDYEETLKLVLSLDAVVTVCQSVAHLSALAGVPTYVLVPSRPAWRYGQSGEQWFWYPDSAVLLRQEGDDWGPAIERLKELLL